jgi:hypothetical protein
MATGGDFRAGWDLGSDEARPAFPNSFEAVRFIQEATPESCEDRDGECAMENEILLGSIRSGNMHSLSAPPFWKHVQSGRPPDFFSGLPVFRRLIFGIGSL